MVTDERSGARPTKVATQACLQCRKVKMKCHKLSQEVRCVRCTRKSLQCDFIEHRRGRKHGFKLYENRSRAQGTAMTTEAFSEAAAAQLSETPRSLPRRVDRESVVGDAAVNLIEPTNVERSTSRPASLSRQTHLPSQGFWTQSNGFRPSDILSRQATQGNFSLQNVLSTEHGDASYRATQSIPDNDPVVKSTINFHVANSLFDGFMKHLNPFISQLDPCLHTLVYIRETSSFLFTAILAAAAKLLHPSLYHALHSHAEQLFMESFRCGSKSTETVQAILILTYWKKPEDGRAWLSVGHAIRMAIELGWHQLGTDAIRLPDTASEQEARKFRNVERTWLVLFVYDRSISLQTGKPWMIDRSSYIESVNKWHSNDFEVTNDRLLCAFVSLRLITSAHYEMLATQYIQHQRHEPSQFRSLLRLLDRQIIDWQKRWTETVTGNGEDCHAFLIPFYGNYARLLLFTSPLRGSITMRDIVTSVDTEAIWNSFSGALEMLKLVSEPSASQLVYFAQDSVHVMIAYATVFLIKLLVSAPAYIRSEMELPAMDVINNAATIFAELQAPSDTSCSLQATFLRNVLIEYESIKERTSRADVPVTRLDSTVSARSQSLRVPDTISACEDQIIQPRLSEGPRSFDLDFADDDVWALIFANAGFNIDQGAFLLPG